MSSHAAIPKGDLNAQTCYMASFYTRGIARYVSDAILTFHPESSFLDKKNKFSAEYNIEKSRVKKDISVVNKEK